MAASCVAIVSSSIELGTGYELCDETTHTLGGSIGGSDHLVAIVRVVSLEVPPLIGDDRHTEDADTRMASHNHLRRRAHANRIGTDRLPILILCGRLVGRTREAYVDTLLERQLLLLSDGLSERNQLKSKSWRSRRVST